MEAKGPGEPTSGGTVTSLVAPTSSPLPAFGHAAFSGHSPARVEPSGRLAIPATYKAAFGAQARIRAYRGTHLTLWTERAFDLVANSMRDEGGLINPQARKVLYRSTHSVAVDRQSRFVIPPELREQVGLTDQVVVVGAIESLEIWPAAAFEHTVVPTFDEADLFFDTYDGLPTDPA